MRTVLGIGVFIGLLATSVAYSASLAPGTISALEPGEGAVSHITVTCELTTSDVTTGTGGAKNKIESVTATITCDDNGTYDVQATVASGASSSLNTNSIALTAGTPGSVVITTGPVVDFGAETGYILTYAVTKQ